MKLQKGIAIDTLIEKMKSFSGADIKSVCTEAGYFAIREDRVVISQDDFFKAVEKVAEEKRFESDEYKRMFG